MANEPSTKCQQCGGAVWDTGCPCCGYGARFHIAGARPLRVPDAAPLAFTALSVPVVLLAATLLAAPFWAIVVVSLLSPVAFGMTVIVLVMNWRRFGRPEKARAAVLLLFADVTFTMASTQFVFNWPHGPWWIVGVVGWALSVGAAWVEVIWQRPLWRALERGDGQPPHG